MVKTYSTKQVATKVKVHWVTLLRWVSSGKVKASIVVPYDGRHLHRWTDADVEKVRRYKEQNYWKGRGAKPKAKQ